MPEKDDLPPLDEELPARASARLGVRARLKQKNSATGIRQPARRCIGERIDIVKSRPWICSRGSPWASIWGVAGRRGRRIGKIRLPTRPAGSRRLLDPGDFPPKSILKKAYAPATWCI